MTELDIPMHGFRPRDYQLGMWNALLRDRKNAVLCWHRRAGKDLLSMQVAIIRMLEDPGLLVWHVLPTAVQGRKVMWDGVTSDGRPFREYFPRPLVVRERDDMMQIKLSNDSIYQVVGGDQADRIVGANPRLVLFSEFALMNPQAWELVRPILRENKGQAAFISTPRGHNHFRELYLAGQEMPEKWYVETLDIRDTKREDGSPVVTEEDVQEEIRLGMPPELAQQEFYCSWNAPLVGSYYGRALEEAEKDGRFVDLPVRKDLPVNTAWDLGISDAMSIIFYQVVGEWVNVIDYYSAHGYGLEHYAKYLQNLPYNYRRHAAPHDIRQRELGTGVSRFETARKLGIKFEICPNMSVEDGISAARMLISRCKFNVRNDGVMELIKALQHYRRNFDTKTRTWGKPVHDWSSHPADAFRYMALTVPKRVYAEERPTIWNRRPTFDEVMDGLVNRARRERRASRKRWI